MQLSTVVLSVACIAALAGADQAFVHRASNTAPSLGPPGAPHIVGPEGILRLAP